MPLGLVVRTIIYKHIFMDFINDIVSFVSGLSSVELSYLFVVLFMFTLAIIDLTVGVSNDAVNFLSSAVGSKAAKLKHVLIVAAVGVFVGAACSSGMMDVARHGIFNPDFFTFGNVMCIYHFLQALTRLSPFPVCAGESLCRRNSPIW